MELIHKDYVNVRGFNYMPSYSFVLNDVMDSFNEQTWDREFGYACELNANSLRIWVSSVSFHRNPKRFISSFQTVLALAEKRGLSILPTLYNRWVDTLYPFGQLDLAHVIAPQPPGNEHVKYVTQMVSAFRSDRRILMWDLCNEPYCFDNIEEGNFKDELKCRETVFWKMVISAARDAQPSQPLTMGTCGAVDHNAMEVYDLEDVISMHPYAGWWNDDYEKEVDTHIKFANEKGKPLICTETCQGSLDDAVRQECITRSLGILKRKGIGWYAWQLCAGEMVSSRRDRTDANAKPGDRGYMCFVLEDGTVRPGHSIVRELNKL